MSTPIHEPTPRTATRPIFIILRLPTSEEAGRSDAATPAELHDLVTATPAAAGTSGDSAFVEQLLSDVLPKGRATITVDQMAKVIGLGRTGAYEAVKRGDIPSRRVNGRLVIPVPALLRWLGALNTQEVIT